MGRSIFRPEGPIWNICNAITDTLQLSCLWCLCSLPLVTMGAATTALYDAAVHGIRCQEGGTYRRFFRTFKAEFKTSLPVTLVWGTVLLFTVYVLERQKQQGRVIVDDGAADVHLRLVVYAAVPVYLSFPVADGQRGEMYTAASSAFAGSGGHDLGGQLVYDPLSRWAALCSRRAGYWVVAGGGACVSEIWRRYFA